MVNGRMVSCSGGLPSENALNSFPWPLHLGGNWAGYVAGLWVIQAHAYRRPKGYFVILAQNE